MFAQERQEKILKMLKNRGSVKVSELSKKLGVSPVTIRKDLESLEAKGVLVRIHGGAMLPNHSKAEWDFMKKLHQKEKEKKEIAKKAVEYIEDGDTIILDSSSTTYYIALELRKSPIRILTIVTNNIFIAEKLIGTSFEILVLGGIIRENSLSLVGSWTSKLIQEINVDKAFLGTTGFKKEKGFMVPNIIEAEVKAEMVKASSKVFIVTDSSKFSRAAFSTFALPEDVDYLITDQNIPKDCEEFLEENNVIVEKV